MVERGRLWWRGRWRVGDRRVLGCLREPALRSICRIVRHISAPTIYRLERWREGDNGGERQIVVERRDRRKRGEEGRNIRLHFNLETSISTFLALFILNSGPFIHINNIPHLHYYPYHHHYYPTTTTTTTTTATMYSVYCTLFTVQCTL